MKTFVHLIFPVTLIFLINLLINYYAFALEKPINITIPAKENGGIDYIGRNFGEFIKSEKIVENVFYYNIPGAAGGRGIQNFLNQNLNENSIIFLSMDMHIADIEGVLSTKNNELKKMIPIAIIAADSSAISVPYFSPYNSINDLLQDYKNFSYEYPSFGGSKKGGIAYLNFILILNKYNFDYRKLRYSASSGGGEAFSKFLKFKNGILLTSISENYRHVKDKKIKVLAVCSDYRLKFLPNVPTFKEIGINNCIKNYRMIYVNKNSSPNKIKMYKNIVNDVYKNKKWEKNCDIKNINCIFINSKNINNTIEIERKKVIDILKKNNIKI